MQWGADHDKFNVHTLNCCLKIDVKQKGNALKLDNIGEKQRSINPNDLFQSCYIYQIFAEFECIGFCSNILCSQDMSTFVGLGFQKKNQKTFFVLRIEKSVRYAIICPFAKLFNDKKYIH